MTGACGLLKPRAGFLRQGYASGRVWRQEIEIKKELKRLVFYFPGYDLRPARQTFHLIRTEFESFLNIRNVDGALSPLTESLEPGGSTVTWNGQVTWPDGKVETRFVQLGWRDIIKPDFQRSWPRTLFDAVASIFRYARAGGYQAVFRSNWAHGIFCLYPAVGLLLYAMACLVPPVLMASTVLRGMAALVPQEYAGLVSWTVLLGGSALWMAAVHMLVSWLEPRSYFRYLVNSWHFIARLARHDHASMLARIEECADLIVAKAKQADEDEELVFVSHSCGTFVAIYILAAVLRRDPDIGRRPGGFAFVTLGPAFDCLGGYGAEHGFGEAMAAVAGSGVDWTDLYSPHDPICGGRTPRWRAMRCPHGEAAEDRSPGGSACASPTGCPRRDTATCATGSFNFIFAIFSRPCVPGCLISTG